MKKFVLTALAALLITGTAFAGSNSGFNVNLARGNSSTIETTAGTTLMYPAGAM